MNLKQRYKFVLYKFTDSHLCWQYAHNAETTSCELWLPFLSGDVSFCCCWVTQSCLISRPPWTAAHQAPLSFTISRSLLQLMSVELVMLSNHLILCRPFPFCLQSFPASGSFQMSKFFTLDGQNIRVSASASVLPMYIQDWSPLGWTGWISLILVGLGEQNQFLLRKWKKQRSGKPTDGVERVVNQTMSPWIIKKHLYKEKHNVFPKKTIAHDPSSIYKGLTMPPNCHYLGHPLKSATRLYFFLFFFFANGAF